jgi:hypothetical protein
MGKSERVDEMIRALVKLRNACKTVVRKPEEKIAWNSQVSIER